MDFMLRLSFRPITASKELATSAVQVLETAVNGRADGLVTFNVRDFGTVPARFGIEVMIPREVLGRMRR